MTRAEAIRIVNQRRPCAHENHSTRLEGGKVWAKCEDCSQTFDYGDLLAIRRRFDAYEIAFDDAMKALRDHAKKGGGHGG